MVQPETNNPFILYRRPGQERLHLASPLAMGRNKLVGEGVEISTWLWRPVDSGAVPRISTPRSYYECTVGSAAAAAAINGGKTVIARQICGSFKNFDPMGMATRYFEAFPDYFCFLFYHPATGYWMGASPELLVRIDGNSGYTQALAGTRPASRSGRWDEKNLEEHMIVVDGIVDSITGIGDEWQCHVAPTGTITYGTIEHLCTRIDFDYRGAGAMPTDSIIGALHPTAAVCGKPRHTAIAAIDHLEAAPRRFYGGLITTTDLAYVILRCVNFDEHNWCIYTGSGITGQSRAADEWAETEAKALPLLKLLNEY